MKRKRGKCPDCGGDGAIPIGEHFVTREMAIDAGEPAMEGKSMGIEYVQCERCEGDGFVIWECTCTGGKFCDECFQNMIPGETPEIEGSNF
jgi:hypothetical protein